MTEDAARSLPAEFAEQVRNVAIAVEDIGPRPNVLGLFQGVPVTAYGSAWSGPRQITLYRLPICAICSSEHEVAAKVREVLIHEFGHYFGIGDARLRELGW